MRCSESRYCAQQLTLTPHDAASATSCALITGFHAAARCRAFIDAYVRCGYRLSDTKDWLSLIRSEKAYSAWPAAFRRVTIYWLAGPPYFQPFFPFFQITGCILQETALHTGGIAVFVARRFTWHVVYRCN